MDYPSKTQAASTRVPFDISGTERSIISSLLQARERFGGGKVVFSDVDRRQMTYDELVRGAFGLGHALCRHARRGKTIGIMLPTGIGAALTFFAVHAFGRVPTMLNFTAGSHNVKAACATAELRAIVTARKFIQFARLEHLVEALSPTTRVLYLEDLLDNLSVPDKIAAVIGPFIPSWLIKRWPHWTSPAAVLFTSGTEGDPKGVVLSHGNILSNVKQVRAHIDIYPASDRLFNPLPMFHCFGLTVGVILPLMVGVGTVFHPSPLHAKEIAKRIHETKATILLATDTFITHYARASDEGDLASLRLAVCGAEHVRDETRRLVRRRCNMEILEGYGVTESAAVIAANQPGDANRIGTVGKLMAGMESRLEPVEGIEGAGRLFVRGPNIMTGYLKADAPGVIQPVRGGWHDTGDIVSIDREGYLTVLGRAKRFAKVGGEMVSLTVVENCASALWPDNRHAAVSVSDGRRGEQIVLVTDAAAADRAALAIWAKKHGMPELALPRHVVHVDRLPLLGTGKPDYPSVTALALERTGVGSTTAVS